MKKISIFAVAIIFAACQSQSDGEVQFGLYATEDCVEAEEAAPVMMASAKAAPTMRSARANGASNADNLETEVTSRKIIKNGSMTLVVDNLEQTRNEVLGLIEKYGGYSSNEQYSNWEHSSSYNFTVRIPCDSFDIFIADIEAGKGKIESKSVYINDVTTEFIDLESRLSTKHSYLERYKQLLKSAKTIQEIVSIEDKIRMLEEDIDSSVGRLKYLTNQVEYSTLHLQLRHDDKNFDPQHPEHNQSITQRLWQSLVSGFRGLVDFAFLLIKLWPIWIVIAVIFIVIRRIRCKKNV